MSRSEIFKQQRQFIRQNGFSFSEGLKKAWAISRLKEKMYKGIVKFHFIKIDGSIREAYGTLNEKLIPPVIGDSNRKKNDTVFVYFDTEKGEWRCFKKANLVI